MKRITLGRLAISALVLAAPLSAANAADLEFKTPTPPPPVGSWTGFYVGLQGGAGFGLTETAVTASQGIPSPPGIFNVYTPGAYAVNALDYVGLHGGGTAGFNWQTGPIVFGVEGDISGADLDGADNCATDFTFGTPSPNQVRCDTKLSAFGTVTGRLGMSSDRMLVYIKGGGAWAHFNQDVTAVNLVFGPGGTVADAASIADNRLGYTVGTGIEYAVWNHWSAKVEYDFLGFGTKNLVFPLMGPNVINQGLTTVNVFANDRESVSVIRAGLNYRF